MLAVRLLCASLSVLLYLNSLAGELVFDDRAAIVENKDLRPSSPWTKLLWHDFWGDELTHHKSHKSYRPLSSATFKLNYHFHQLEVFGYHVVNVLLSGLVCYLFVQVCELVFSGRSPWSAYLAGLLFTTHPVHTEAVASVVGRTELLCCLFYLSSLLAYHKSVKCSSNGVGWKWLLLSMVFCLCSFMSKEQGITAPAVCLVYEASVVMKLDVRSAVHLLKSVSRNPAEKLSKSQKRFIVRVLLMTLFVLVVVASRMTLMQGAPKFSRSDNPGQRLSSPYRQLYYLHLVFVNLWLLLCPSHLIHDWRFGFVPLFDSFLHFHHILTLLTFVLIGILVYCSIISRHSSSTTPAAFGVALMIITFLPASNLFFLVGFVVAERVLFLPSMGCCIIIAFGASKMIDYFDQRFVRAAIKVAFTSLLLSYLAKTLVRNTKWSSGTSLYIEALKLNREDGLMYSNLGYSLEEKDQKMAEQAHRLAVQLSPNYSQPFRNYGALLMRQERYSEAEKMFQRATEILGKRERSRSKSVETYQSLAYVISMNHSRIPEALNVLEVALTMKPGVLELLNMKGYFLHMLDRADESVATLKQVLKVNPSNRDSIYHLGMAYSKLRESEKAEMLFRRVLELDSTNGRAMLHLGLLLAKRETANGETLIEAGRYLKSVTLADPRQVDALHGLGLVYMKLKKGITAEEYYLKALAIEPHHQDTILDLGRHYYDQRNYTEVVKVLTRLPQSLLFDYTHAGSMLVRSYLQLGQAKEAEGIFEAMLLQESQQHKIEALNGLGELKLHGGDYQMAKTYFTRTLELDRNNELATKRIRKLNSLLPP